MIREFKSLPGVPETETNETANQVNISKGNIKEFKSLPSPGLLKRFGISSLGYIPRTAAWIEAAPHNIGQTVSDMSTVFTPRPTNTEFDQRMREKYGPEYDQKTAIQPTPNLLQSFPSTEQNLEEMQNSWWGKLMPKGALTGTGPIEQYADAITRGALGYGATSGVSTARSAMAGGSNFIESLLSGLKSVPETAMRAAPVIAGGMAAKEGGKALNLGPNAQSLLELGGMAATEAIPGAWGFIKKALPGGATRFGRTAVERYAPFGKEVTAIANATERKNLVESKRISSEKKSIEKALEKARIEGDKAEQSRLAAERAKLLKEEAQNKKNLESYRTENLKTRQEELDVLETQKIEHEAKIKELGEQKKLLEEQESKIINEQSKLDAMKLKEKGLTGKALEKQKAESITQQSKLDAMRTKRKGIEAELETVKQEHAKTKTKIEDIKLIEDAVVEHFGATPEILSKRAKRLYSDFSESIPKDTLESAGSVQSFIRKTREKMASSETSQAKDVVESLLRGAEKRIKDGKITIENLVGFRQDINEAISRLYRHEGGLTRFEGFLTEAPKVVDQMLDAITKRHPSMKVDLFHEANRLTRNAHLSGDFINWSEKRFPRVRQSAKAILQSPEYRRYLGNAIDSYAKGELTKATKYLSAIKIL